MAFERTDAYAFDHTPNTLTQRATEVKALGSGQEPVRDVIGIGFGPANLALAVAIREHNAQTSTGSPIDGLFLERKSEFSWHSEALIHGSTVQISFLKDLVTIRNPSSQYTFLQYLKARNRLMDFINLRDFFPSRLEYSDYLQWAAADFADVVTYDTNAVQVRGVAVDGAIEVLEVDACRSDGSGPHVVRRARNAVIATGLAPHLPANVQSSKHVIHNHHLLNQIPDLRRREPQRFVVVGTGQSAADTLAHLHNVFPDAEVCAVISRIGFSPQDDSPGVNRIFNPETVDLFYNAPAEVRRYLMEAHRNANYSVVDTQLLHELYQRVYQEKVAGRERLKIYDVARVLHQVERTHGVTVIVESLCTGERTELDADMLVFATGYRPHDPAPLLENLRSLCHFDDDGHLSVDRDYRVQTDKRLRAGLYLQGPTEKSHGITSSLLSNLADRAGEIVGSIIAHARPPFVGRWDDELPRVAKKRQSRISRISIGDGGEK